MDLGLVSDTHLRDPSKIPKKVFEIFDGVKLIIHAGDILSFPVLERLGEIAEVRAVSSDSDLPDVKDKLPKFDSFKIHKWRIGIIHNAGLFGLSGAKKIAIERNLDVLVFGHTHKSLIKRENNVLFVNPGSPTRPIPFLTKPSVGLLKVTRKEGRAEIINL